MAGQIGRMAGNDDDVNGVGGPAPSTGTGKVKFGKSGFSKSGVLGKKRVFAGEGAGKLNKSGATTKSESLARLRGKGALA